MMRLPKQAKPVMRKVSTAGVEAGVGQSDEYKCRECLTKKDYGEKVKCLNRFNCCKLYGIGCQYIYKL
jgi:hypothetical protein